MTRKEALEYINNMWMSGETHDALEVLIPEFAESEDEMIRMELVAFFKGMQDKAVMLGANPGRTLFNLI